MYNAHDVLANIDAHVALIVLFCGLALAFNYAWYVELIRVARRDHCYTLPPAVTLLYLAHDGSYVALFDKWFNGPYAGWFSQLFWVAIIFTFLGEVIIFAQTLKYGREELMPDASQKQFTLLMLAGLAITIVCWVAVKVALDDPLFLLSFEVLIVWPAPFASAMMFRRRGARGTSRWTWISATMIGVLYGFASLLWFGPDFRTIPWIALWIGGMIWGGFNIAIAHRYLTATTATSAAVGSAAA